jgi:osmotically-inducible protein OsmY
VFLGFFLTLQKTRCSGRRPRLACRFGIIIADHAATGLDNRTFSQAVLDATTTALVKTALTLTKGLKSQQIHVSTRWGTITLEGNVGTGVQKFLAERTARSTQGVRNVENHLEVRD